MKPIEISEKNLTEKKAIQICEAIEIEVCDNRSDCQCKKEPETLDYLYFNKEKIILNTSFCAECYVEFSKLLEWELRRLENEKV